MSFFGEMGQAPAPDDQPLSLPAESILTGVFFGLGLPVAQYAGRFCRISCATPCLSSIFGAAAVAICSTTSVQIVHHVKKCFFSAESQENYNVPKLLQLSVPALIGIVSFKALGGKYRNLLPSDVRYPGVYAKMFLPSSGAHYASPSQRFLIRTMFKQFGCHHCGRTTGESIADHMPPNAVHWKSRRLIKVTQKYYPQCIPCMRVQSGALRHGLNPLVFHSKSGWPEPCVFSGFLLAALEPDADHLKDEWDCLIKNMTELYQDEYRLGTLYNLFRNVFGTDSDS